MYFISVLFFLCGCRLCSSLLYFFFSSFVLSQLSPRLSAPCLLRRGCRQTLSEARWDVRGSGNGRSQDCLPGFFLPGNSKTFAFFCCCCFVSAPINLRTFPHFSDYDFECAAPVAVADVVKTAENWTAAWWSEWWNNENESYGGKTGDETL